MTRLLERLVPGPLRRALRGLRGGSELSPVSEEWEWYARDHRRSGRGPSTNLGDEWNRPEVIGIDAPADRVLAELDARVFAPFLGRPDTLLEIGSGGGRFTELLLGKARRVIAADTSPTMIRLLRERFRDRNGIELLLLDGRGLGAIPARSLDAAFSYDVFVHLRPWDIFVYLLELKRTLKPGGKAVLHHAHTFSDLGWRRFVTEVEQCRAGHTPKAAFTLMTPAIMAELVRRAGLEVVESVTEVVRRDCITLIRAPEGER